MKKKMLITIISALSYLLQAQIINYAHHLGSETSSHMTGIHAKSFYLEKSWQLNTCCNDRINVVGMGGNGKEMFRTMVNSGAWREPLRIVATADQCLLVLSGTDLKGCDYLGAEYKISKLDTLGNILWDTILGYQVKDILPWPDGSLYYTTESTLYHLDSGNQYLFDMFTGFTGINSMTRWHDDKLLFNYSDSAGNHFSALDTLMSVSYYKTSLYALNQMQQLPDSTLLSMSAFGIHKFSNDLTLQYSSITTIPYNYTIHAFCCRNDSVFVAGRRSPIPGPFFAILDMSLSPLYISASNLINSVATGIYAGQGSALHIITHGASMQDCHPYTGYFQTGISGNLHGGRDIGVLGINIINAMHKPHGGSRLQGTLDADVSVKNYGTDTVRSFRLNHLAYEYGFCQKLIGLNKSYTVSIPPGDTVTVNTGTFNITSFSTKDLEADQSYNFTVCIATSVPDNLSDLFAVNDYACSGVSFVAVGLQEESVGNISLKLFPNPSSSGFYVASETRISAIELSDLSGRVLKHSAVNATKIFVNTSEFHRGLYLIRIYTGETTVVRKMLLE